MSLQKNLSNETSLKKLTTNVNQQGEIVPSAGVLRPFTLKMKPGTEETPWTTNIVMSTNSRDRLPTNTYQDGATRVCDVSSVLKGRNIEMKMKNRHWWNTGERYLRLRFDIKVVLGPADLKFVLQSKDRQVLNEDHRAIEVVWEVPIQAPISPGGAMGNAALYSERP